MNIFETAARFDALAISIVLGSVLLLGFFVWVLFDRREYEDPMDRRRRDRAPGPRDASSGEDAPGVGEREAAGRRPA